MVSIFISIIKDIIYNTEFVSFMMVIEINLMMFGITLGCIGILGQYIGRIFDESKGRPIYIIDSTVNYGASEKKYKISN